jgi:hypothetical protein
VQPEKCVARVAGLRVRVGELAHRGSQPRGPDPRGVGGAEQFVVVEGADEQQLSSEHSPSHRSSRPIAPHPMQVKTVTRPGSATSADVVAGRSGTLVTVDPGFVRHRVARGLSGYSREFCQRRGEGAAGSFDRDRRRGHSVALSIALTVGTGADSKFVRGDSRTGLASCGGRRARVAVSPSRGPLGNGGGAGDRPLTRFYSRAVRRPVVEIMTPNFIPVAMDQVINHAAKIHCMFGGLVKCLRTMACAGPGAMVGMSAITVLSPLLITEIPHVART